jgi:SAM-dependent methyltransferase
MNSSIEDLDGLKNRLKQTWTAGDYGIIARGLARSAETFLSRASLQPGERLLDVACGAGQIALPAARDGADVTGIDIAENWIEQAKSRAKNEGLDIRFDVGDAEDMPYADDAFDVVISLIGAMFAPKPERVTTELVRVCRPGGRIVMGNWTPEGFVGDFFRTVGQYVPPPDMPSPLLWGDVATVKERLGPSVSKLRLDRRHLHFDYPMPPAEVADHYLEHFGPTKKAAEAVGADDREALRRDLERLWANSNQATDGTTQVDAEILEVVAIV